jgi:hypothetical protein
MGSAVGAAAAMCLSKKLTPRQLAEPEAVRELQQSLLREDHYIIGVSGQEETDLAQREDAKVSASSQKMALSLESADKDYAIDCDRMIMFPAQTGMLPWVDVLLTARADTTLSWQLHRPDGTGLTVPSQSVTTGELKIQRGEKQWLRIRVNAHIESSDFYMLELKRNPELSWHTSQISQLGLKSYFQYTPRARHHNEYSRFASLGSNREGLRDCHCIRLPEDSRIFSPENVRNGFSRPYKGLNVWSSRKTNFDQPEWLELSWKNAVNVREIEFRFDSDLDRHLTAIWVSAPYTAEPDLVKEYDLQLRIKGSWRTALEVRNNYLRRRVHKLEQAQDVEAVRLNVKATHGIDRVHVYEMRVY